MARRLAASWQMKSVMRARGWSVSDVMARLPDYGVHVSRATVYREFSGSNKTGNLRFVAVFCDMVGCTMNDLIAGGWIEALPAPPEGGEPAPSPLPRIGLPDPPANSWPPLRPLS